MADKKNKRNNRNNDYDDDYKTKSLSFMCR